ncbi:hypothetical protein CTRI78_v011994 [Colletotrichum trifolii]|uniref:Uncharacterized protein n=1 Tax=Colletotrichum trifolii TaxID=5466 RepID=A0A4R8PSB3_COLTR|nr:hypothetical protein CTRI78_v011994 [Colletotrichum trifolii]
MPRLSRTRLPQSLGVSAGCARRWTCARDTPIRVTPMAPPSRPWCRPSPADPLPDIFSGGAASAPGPSSTCGHV